MKFKVNDKVRIIGKNRGKGFNSNDPNLKWRIGDIAYIQNNDKFDKFDIFLKKTPNDILAEWGAFAEEDLELVQDLKVGDKVEILNKSAGDVNRWFKWKKGDIGIIRSIVGDGLFYINSLKGERMNGAFKEYDLRLIPKEEEMTFNVGDKVKILSKSIGWKLEEAWEKGDIGTITYINESTLKGEKSDYTVNDGKGKGGFFMKRDLELVKEPVEIKREYKFIKGFKPYNLIANSPASIEEKDKFNRKMIDMGYGLYDSVKMDKVFYDYFTKHECFIKYLLENNYIKKEIIFEPFKITFDVTNKEEFKVLYDAIGKLSCFGAEWDILSKKEKEIS